MDNRTILLIDDDEGLLQLHQLALRIKTDFNIRTAATGQAALDQIKGMEPALVILDLMMPDIDGVELCRYMRTQPGLSRTPIVILTGLDDASAHERAREAGANAIWLKPLTPSELVSQINQVLDRHA